MDNNQKSIIIYSQITHIKCVIFFVCSVLFVVFECPLVAHAFIIVRRSANANWLIHSTRATHLNIVCKHNFCVRTKFPWLICGKPIQQCQSLFVRVPELWCVCVCVRLVFDAFDWFPFFFFFYNQETSDDCYFRNNFIFNYIS